MTERREYAVLYKGIINNRRHVEIIPFEDSLEWLQKQVGGYIESFHPTTKLTENNIIAWINEEGKMLKLEPTFILTDGPRQIDVVVGNMLFTAINGPDTIGLTPDEVNIVIGWLNDREVWGNDKLSVLRVDMTD